MITNLLM